MSAHTSQPAAGKVAYLFKDAPVPLHQCELTLMFADMVDYSRLMGRNQSAAIRLLTEYRRRLTRHIEVNQGTLLEYAGDCVFARFPSPSHAIRAAVNSQKELASCNDERAEHAPLLRMRIGLHCGRVAVSADGLFGDDVNIAARLEPLAVADAIAISKPIYDAVRDDLHAPVKHLGIIRLKNIDQKVRVYLVKPGGFTWRDHWHYFIRAQQQKLVKHRYVMTAGILMALSVLAYCIPRWFDAGYLANYVEVATFDSLSADQRSDYLSEGITRAVRAQLAGLENVYVMAAEPGVEAPLRLQGYVQRADTRIRLMFELIRARDGAIIAGSQLDGDFDELFILQDRLVGQISTALAREFKVPDFRPAPLALTSNALALDYYMRGDSLLHKPARNPLLDEALNWFYKSLTHDPNFNLAKLGICRAFVERHKLNRTTSSLTTAVAKCEAAARQGVDSAELSLAMHQLHLWQGRTDLAMAALASAEALGAPPEIVELEKAKLYGRQNRKPEAIAALRLAVEKNPANWKLREGFARFLFDQQSYGAAIQELEQVLRAMPRNSSAGNELGVAYFFTDQFDKAAQAFENALDVSPDAASLSNIGTMHFYSGAYLKSEKYYRRAAKLSPGDYQITFNLAEALRAQNKAYRPIYAQALGAAAAKLVINPIDVSARLVVAASNFMLGHSKLAWIGLLKAQALEPNNQELNYFEVKFLAMSGDSDGAQVAALALIKNGFAEGIIKADPDLDSLNL